MIRQNPCSFLRLEKALYLVDKPLLSNPIPVSKLGTLVQYQTPLGFLVLDDFSWCDAILFEIHSL